MDTLEKKVRRLLAQRDAKVAEARSANEHGDTEGFNQALAYVEDLDSDINDALQERELRHNNEHLDHILRPENREARRENREGGTYVPSIMEYRNALNSQVGSEGGYAVPVDHRGMFWDRLRDASVLLTAGPHVLETDRGEVHVPKIGASADANWVAEGNQIPTSRPDLARIEVKPAKIAALTEMTAEVAADSNPSARDLVAYDLTRTLAVSMDNALLVGDGTGAMPTGIANQDGVTTTAIGGTATMDDVADSLARVEASNATPNAIFASPEQYASWRQEKDNDGRPLLQPDMASDARRSVFGVPVYVSGHLSGLDRVITADLRQVIFVRRSDVRIKMSEDYRFDYDLVAVRVIARVNAAVANAEAVDVLDTTETA